MSDTAGAVGNKAKLEKIPISFQLGDTLIDGATVQPLTFAGFNSCVAEAYTLRQPTLFEAKFRRVRLSKHVHYSSNGTAVSVSLADIPKLSIADARKIIAKLDVNDDKAGKIVRDGDGVSTALTYELGTPIPLGQGKQPIRELEFLAATYGDVEDILAIETPVLQAAKLIETLGKPLGTSLTSLPSWALNLITVADGIAITNDVLPRFLGSPDE